MEFKTELEMWHALQDVLNETWTHNESERIKALKQYCANAIEDENDEILWGLVEDLAQSDWEFTYILRLGFLSEEERAVYDEGNYGISHPYILEIHKKLVQHYGSKMIPKSKEEILKTIKRIYSI